MNHIFIFSALLSFNLLSKAYEKKFEDCFFIGNNLSSVQFIFSFDSHRNYSHNNCFEKIDDENIENNIKFAKFSDLDLLKRNLTKTDMEEFANKFQGIRALDISNNSLTLHKINVSAVFSFRNLVFLNVSHNQLAVIANDLFHGMGYLSEIDLSFNRLTHIFNWFGDPFLNLTELKVIDLRNNQITYIGSAFDDNRKLKILRLENNPIANIYCETFKLLERSVSVGISWDHVIDMDMRCMENKLKITVEKGKIIIRSSNSKKELCIDESNFKKWFYIYFGTNQMSNVSNILYMLGPSVRDLRLNGNFIGKLNATTFERFIELEQLHLDRTNLSAFDCNPFEKLTNLTVLRMANNNFRKFNVTLLSTTLMKLKEFDIDGNNIDTGYEIIQHLGPDHYYIDVSRNFVGKLNVSTFQRFGKLWALFMSQTNLTEFDCNPFESLNDLGYLDISYNNLKKLNATLLSSTLNQLVEFNVSGNNLRNTHEIVRHLNPSIRVLDLSENYLEKFDENTFERFHLLEELFLKCTNLTDFDMNSFRQKENLVKLDFSHNNLTSVNSSYQGPFEKLEMINLNWNNLTELNGLTQVAYPKLKYLHIEGNRFTCEYISNFKWDDLQIIGDPCDE